MGRFTRREDIDRKRRRRVKIKKLKAKIAKAKNSSQIETLIAKILRISPHYPVQQP